MTGIPRHVALRWVLNLAAAGRAMGQVAEQEPRPSPYEFGLSVTVQSPRDVNQRPHCTSFGLPCMSPRTFPDFGAGLVAAVFPRDRVGVAAEVGGFANRWRSSSTGPGGNETNAVQFALAGLIARSPLLRYGTSKPTFVRVFGQVMGGLLTSTLGASETVVQAGLGADGLVDRSLWFRFQVDYRVANSGPRNLSSGRALFALMAKP